MKFFIGMFIGCILMIGAAVQDNNNRNKRCEKRLIESNLAYYDKKRNFHYYNSIIEYVITGYNNNK